MSKIIQEAFDEGRETNITWEKSQAKLNQFKVDLFTSNINNFNGKKFNKKIQIRG